MELKLCLENFPVSSPLIVTAGCVTGFSCRVRLEDSAGRRLFLQAFVVPFSEARIKVIFVAINISVSSYLYMYYRLPYQHHIGLSIKLGFLWCFDKGVLAPKLLDSLKSMK